jgi:hypothetical protein
MRIATRTIGIGLFQESVIQTSLSLNEVEAVVNTHCLTLSWWERLLEREWLVPGRPFRGVVTNEGFRLVYDPTIKPYSRPRIRGRFLPVANETEITISDGNSIALPIATVASLAGLLAMPLLFDEALQGDFFRYLFAWVSWIIVVPSAFRYHRKRIREAVEYLAGKLEEKERSLERKRRRAAAQPR